MMRVGTENRTQLIILGILVLLALFALPRFFSGGAAKQTPQAAAAGTLAPKRTSANAARAGKRPPARKALLTASLDPSLRFDLLKQGEQEYEGGKRNIFSAAPVDIPKPVDNGSKVAHVDPGPVPPPPPPPIPLKFYGFASQPGQAKRIFLSSGDDIFVGTEGQVINRRYRIVKVNNTSVDIEDILNNIKQTIPLTPVS